MLNLNEIKAPIEKNLVEFEKKFRSSMQSSVPLLDTITQYIIKRKGKQMRPMFVFFTAGMCGDITDASFRAASLIELLHTATLVHDDVVDDSNERRGFFSINALWKNKIAVLVGDYLLSKGLLLSIDNNDFELLRIVSNATREMSEGELLQIEKARRLDISEEIYFEIIRKKTASLIASCCATGAASSGASTEVINKLHQFGEHVGIAFQIRDDLFDYQQENHSGKPKGLDIRDKKMTLPLIYLLNKSTMLQKRHIIHIVRNHSTEPERVEEVINLVKNSGGIEYAHEMMMKYCASANDIINEFPDSPYKSSLIQLVQYTIERNK
jgi:octaprenyl-diphosphate synthase